MQRPKRDQFMRHEPEVTSRRPTTQRNLVSPLINPGADDDSEEFGTPTRDSTVVQVRRDRTPKGVNDGRGKRSVKDMLLSIPTPEGRAIYAMERVAALEDQIQKVIDLCDDETKEIIFKRRKTLKERYGNE